MHVGERDDQAGAVVVKGNPRVARELGAQDTDLGVFPFDGERLRRDLSDINKAIEGNVRREL